MRRENALEVFSAVKERIEHFKECGCRFPLWPITERDEEAIDIAIEALQAEPVKHGKWKIDEYGIHHCPFCYAINNTVYKSFCPNCGAKMDKGSEDE